MELQPEYVMELFVSGAAPNSLRAINNLKLICDKHINSKYSLEIIDVYQDGARAMNAQIVALPLLIRRSPLPVRKLIGDMSDTEKVLKGLGLLN